MVPILPISFAVADSSAYHNTVLFGTMAEFANRYCSMGILISRRYLHRVRKKASSFSTISLAFLDRFS